MSVITTNLYKLYRRYYSTDSGTTWVPLDEYGYTLKEVDAAQCMPIPDYKARLTLTGGTTVDIPWNGSTVLTSGETSQYSASTVSAVVSNGVTKIDGDWDAFNGAFKYFTSLTSITIPNTVSIIGAYAFSHCSGLTEVNIGSGVTTIDHMAFLNCSSLTSIVIPNSVTMIEVQAFQGCSSLTSVTIPDSVTSIGGGAFKNCSNITDVSIGSGLTGIYYDTAFDGCTSLSSITVDSNNTVYDSRNNCNAIIETSTNKLIQGCKNTIIPNSVTSIGRYAFQYCSSLSSITIPSGVTSIGSNAFYYCSGLTSINIPDSVTFIAPYAFSHCSGITEANIGSGVTYIGDNAFQGCTSLTEITCNATTAPSVLGYTFEGVATGGTLTYPSGSDYSQWLSNDQYYLGYYGWTEPEVKPSLITNKAIIKTTGGTWVGIPRNSSSSLTSGETSQYRSTAVDVEIGSGITTLGTAVFSGFSKLDSIIFGDDVRSVGTSAFTWDSGLTTVVFNNGITSLSDVAFGGCSGIQHITLPSTITSMGNSCFDTCTKLEEVTIPNGLTAINVYCFHYCPSLTSATIPSGVSTIGDNAFSGCTGLAEITCNRNTAPTISANTFKNLPSTGTLYVPSGSNYSTWIAKLPNWTIQYI